MATLLKMDGTKEEIIGEGKLNPKNGKRKITLEQAQRLVGGLVECVDVTNRRTLLINEEGKFLYGPNRAATLLWIETYGLNTGDFIAGPALLTERGEGWSR